MAEKFCMHSKTMKDFIDENFKDIRAPFSAGIELTAKCNLNCIHCYAKPDRGHKDMTTDEFKKIFDVLIENGLLEAYLTGGEIFTRSDFNEIYKYAKSKGVLLSLLTNITLLNESHIELFETYPVEIISTTMYGVTEATYESVTGVKGSYAMFMRGLELLQKHNIPFELKYVAMRPNFHEIEMARDFGHKIGSEMHISTKIHAMNDGSTMPLELRMTAKEAFEREISNPSKIAYFTQIAEDIIAGRTSIYPKRAKQRFDAGYLYPCMIACQDVFITSDCKMQGCVRVPYYQYDLRTGTFEEGWEYLKKMTLDKKASSNYKCLNCENAKFCEHCVGNFMLSYGDEEHVDPFTCELAQLRMQYVKNVMQHLK